MVVLQFRDKYGGVDVVFLTFVYFITQSCFGGDSHKPKNTFLGVHHTEKMDLFQ